ncbi:MAG: alpha/beta hydrolase [Rhizobacter sp.]
MNPRTLKQTVVGAAGLLECAIDMPGDGNAPVDPKGWALICHPHPQHGGTMDNKVVQTVARALLQLGYQTVRFNYRGVGASQGHWDEGRGELDDVMSVLAAHRKPGLPFVLAGFSFGAYMASQAIQQLSDDEKPQQLVLVGPSTQRQVMPNVPSHTVVIHGESDEVVPLTATMDWARPQALPVIVFPGVGHFFHGQLALLRSTVVQQLQARGI